MNHSLGLLPAYLRDLNKNLQPYNIYDDTILRLLLHQRLLDVSQIESLCRLRYWLFVVILDNFRVLKDIHPACADTTIETNISVINNTYSDYAKARSHSFNEFGINQYYFSTKKIDIFCAALSSAPSFKNCWDQDILYIGARTEGELFYFSTKGYDINRIKCIDLYSYSTFIDLGDMHSIPHNSCSFDTVLLTHSITYSEDPAIAFSESFRTLRPGGILFVSISLDNSVAKTKQNLDTDRPRTGAVGALSMEGYVKTFEQLNLAGKYITTLVYKSNPSMSISLFQKSFV